MPRPTRGNMKPPIIFIHGMWSTGATLEPIQKVLEMAGYTCYAPTLPFHENGGHAQAVARQSHHDYVTFIIQYIQNLKLETAPVLIGHSMGGLLAQLVAVKIQPRAVVLFAPAAAAGINGFAISSVRSLSHALFSWKFWEKSQIHPSLERAQYALFNNLPLNRQKELFALLVPESGKVVFEAGFGATGKGKPTWVDFAKITAPILVLHGTDDRIVIVQGSRQLVKKYSSIELKEYIGSGHWLFEEKIPVLEDMKNWLEEHL